MIYPQTNQQIQLTTQKNVPTYATQTQDQHPVHVRSQQQVETKGRQHNNNTSHETSNTKRGVRGYFTLAEIVTGNGDRRF